MRLWETTPASLVVTSSVGYIYTQEEVIHRNQLPGSTEYMGAARPHARGHHHRHLPLVIKIFKYRWWNVHMTLETQEEG